MNFGVLLDDLGHFSIKSKTFDNAFSIATVAKVEQVLTGADKYAFKISPDNQAVAEQIARLVVDKLDARSVLDPVANLFRVPRHDIPSDHHRELRTAAMQRWNEIARLQAA